MLTGLLQSSGPHSLVLVLYPLNFFCRPPNLAPFGNDSVCAEFPNTSAGNSALPINCCDKVPNLRALISWPCFSNAWGHWSQQDWMSEELSLKLKKLHFPIYSKRTTKCTNEKGISQLLPGLPPSWSTRLQESPWFIVLRTKNCQATSRLELQKTAKLFCHFLVRKQPD